MTSLDSVLRVTKRRLEHALQVSPSRQKELPAYRTSDAQGQKTAVSGRAKTGYWCQGTLIEKASCVTELQAAWHSLFSVESSVCNNTPLHFVASVMCQRNSGPCPPLRATILQCTFGKL